MSVAPLIIPPPAGGRHKRKASYCRESHAPAQTPLAAIHVDLEPGQLTRGRRRGRPEPPPALVPVEGPPALGLMELFHVPGRRLRLSLSDPHPDRRHPDVPL